MTPSEYNDNVYKHSDSLYRFALRYTGDSQESEDCVQDCFVLLWEHRDEIEANGAKGYLMRVMYRKLVDMHRHKVVERDVKKELTPKQEDYNHHHDFELHDAIQKALNQLPDIQRQLILMKDLEGYDYHEISNITGLSEQQVGVYLYRARKTMKTLLEPLRS